MADAFEFEHFIPLVESFAFRCLDVGLHREDQPQMDTDKHGFGEEFRTARCSVFFISVFICVNPWFACVNKNASNRHVEALASIPVGGMNAKSSWLSAICLPREQGKEGCQEWQ